MHTPIKVDLVRQLRERSLWKDSKGRTLMVLLKWHQGVTTDFKCTDVEFFIIDTLTIVRRPFNQVAAWVENGTLTYSGECTDGNLDKQ